MFCEPRRKDRTINDEQIREILKKGEYGILASFGADGFPYAIPFSYALKDGKLYIHCTNRESHNRDNLRFNCNVCFTVIGDTELLPDKFGTCYESVVVFGQAREVSDDDQRLTVLNALLQKYSADFMREGGAYIQAMWHAVSVIEITPLHITGKARRKNGKSNMESGYIAKKEEL